MKQACLAFALIGLSAAPALATGGFSCSIDDANLRFDTQSALGRGMGSPIIKLEAAGNILLKGTPADFARLDLSKHLVHSWMLHPDLRLHFYRERDNDKSHASLELVISATSADDEGNAVGTYQLTVFSTDDVADGATLEATGKVTCTVE
jgi:hypothetical protein